MSATFLFCHYSMTTFRKEQKMMPFLRKKTDFDRYLVWRAEGKKLVRQKEQGILTSNLYNKRG